MQPESEATSEGDEPQFSPAEGEILDLVGAIYDAGADSRRWEGVLGKIARWLDADKALLGISELSPRRGSVFATYRLADGALTQWQTKYTEEAGPWALAGESLPEGTVVAFSRLVPVATLHESKFYREFLHPLDIEDNLGAVVAKRNSLRGWINLFQGREKGLFSDQQMARFRLLVPHLQRAVQIHGLLTDRMLRQQADAAAFDLFPFGVISCDECAAVITANRVAQTILETGDGLCVEEGRLRVCDPQEQKTFHALLCDSTEEAASDNPSIGGVMQVSRNDAKRPLSLLVSRLSFEVLALEVSAGSKIAHAIIIVSAPEVSVELPHSTLSKLFDLTPAEAQLTLAVTLGDKSVQQFAEETGISVATARWHLKQVLSKTGVHRQAELVALIHRSVTLFTR